MKLQYMGTAAAEAMPALFCECDTCRRARAAGGKNIRMRSGLLVNDSVLIDYCPDVYALSMKFDLHLSGVTDLFITHSHHDHFHAEDLLMRRAPVFRHAEDKLRLFVNEATLARLDEAVKYDHEGYDSYLDITTLAYFKPYQTVGGLTVTCLPANHAPKEKAGFYMLSDGEKTVVYAHDTGVFPEETMAFLKTQSIDLISLDCCYGRRSNRNGHMGMPENREMVAELRAAGALKADATVIVNHFSHNCGQLHEELEAEVAKDGFVVSYDGMIVEL